MIRECLWKGQRISCAAIFTLHPTDKGMCCAFNKQKADEMFFASRYQEQIKRLTDQDKKKSREDSRVPDWQAPFLFMHIAFMNNMNYYFKLGLIQLQRQGSPKVLCCCLILTLTSYPPHLQDLITFRRVSH